MTNTEATKSYFTDPQGNDYLRFEGLRIGRKRYEVVLTIFSGKHGIEVYECVRNEPPRYLDFVAPSLWAKLDAAMKRVK